MIDFPALQVIILVVDVSCFFHSFNVSGLDVIVLAIVKALLLTCSTPIGEACGQVIGIICEVCVLNVEVISPLLLYQATITVE